MADDANAADAVEAVRRYALRVATGDRVLAVRHDVSAEDVAQEVALDFHRLAAKPDHWKAWTAQVTRHRLADLARRHRVAADYLQTYLEGRVQWAMGPSAFVVAGDQVRRALWVLTEAERDLFGDHLLGTANADLAERYGYRSSAVVSTLLSRIRKKIEASFPGLALDLEPQRVYPMRLDGGRRGAEPPQP